MMIFTYFYFLVSSLRWRNQRIEHTHIAYPGHIDSFKIVPEFKPIVSPDSENYDNEEIPSDDVDGGIIQENEDIPDDNEDVFIHDDPDVSNEPIETDSEASTENRKRRKAVRDAFIYSFNGYEKHAWGYDELKPLSGGGRNWVTGGIGMMIIDSLDTAVIMGLENIASKCVSWIKSHLSFDRDAYISVFETTIRIVGGLISGYDLLGEEILLERATDIADRLLPAFKTPTGVPNSEVNLKTGHSKQQGWTSGAALLSEFGTMQLEFRKLSYLTGDTKYDDAVTKVMDVLKKHSRPDGQYPCFYNNKDDKFRGDLIKWGAWGDSFYEYLIKQYLLTMQTEPKYWEMYEKAVEGMHNKLIKKGKEFTYLIEVDSGRDRNKMDHLVCFAVGMLVIGSTDDIDSNHNKAKDLQVAKELGETCYRAYQRSPSGLAPDSWRFSSRDDVQSESSNYLLRPEAVEGLFYLWRATGDQKYRDWGWEIFQAIERHCKTDIAYSSLGNVKDKNPRKVDEMHTFFLGETLKYLYLLFAPNDLIPLDEFVFNTEAHPIRRYIP